MWNPFAKPHRRSPKPFQGCLFPGHTAWVVLASLLLQGLPLRFFVHAASSTVDPYLRYLQTAPEFQSVSFPEGMGRTWDTWLYMPWRYQWTIGTSDAGGQFCRDYGIRGGFVDHASGPFDWLKQWNLRFYTDHVAGKGTLYLKGANQKNLFSRWQRDPMAIRRNTDDQPMPLDESVIKGLEARVRERAARVRDQGGGKGIALALDDEVSWGAFVVPIPWRLHEDRQDYAGWLKQYYGAAHAPVPQYVTPDDLQPLLKGPLAQVDFSPLLDRMTYNDSLWAKVIGRLVRAANEVDPSAPCGIVGGQSPNLWGGYDYAKLVRQTQFLEVYDLGSAQQLVQSLAPDPRMAVVTTHFHRAGSGTARDHWQAWHYFARGNRGIIGWVEGWFDAQGSPQPWLADYSRTLKELSDVQAPKVQGSLRPPSEILLYYSHPSVQVSWMLDAEAHGKTWVNRGKDHLLGTSHLTRLAWQRMLEDEGLAYDFVDYANVATGGVPSSCRVLILPAAFALSDLEARRIREFVQNGGVVVADFMCGLWDHHGRGRRSGALDSLFGVRHDGTERAEDFFADRLWVETDQDRGFGSSTHRALLETLKPTLREGYAVAEKRLPISSASFQEHGHGQSWYLNLSPQRYLIQVEEGNATAESRRPFLEPIRKLGLRPRLQVKGLGRASSMGWRVDRRLLEGREFWCVTQNPLIRGDSQGGGGASGLQSGPVQLRLTWDGPRQDIRDERTGRTWSEARTLDIEFRAEEAIFLSHPSYKPVVR